MDPSLRLKLILEGIWWLLTLVIVGFVLMPIPASLSEFPFLTSNIVFLVIFITFTRHIFFLKHSFLARATYLKVFILMISIPMVFLLIEALIGFQTFVDENSYEGVLAYSKEKLSNDQQFKIAEYIKKEMLFFGAASIIAALALPFRLVLSLWRGYNRGTI